MKNLQVKLWNNSSFPNNIIENILYDNSICLIFGLELYKSE